MQESEDSIIYNSNPSDSSSHEVVVAIGGTSVITRFNQDRLVFARKRLKQNFVSNVPYSFAFRKEFEIAHELIHPNIARYFFFGEDANGPFIVLEWIDGISLREKMGLQSQSQVALRIKGAELWFKQVCEALDYLVRKGAVHGDLKPENILISNRTNEAKLIDFGHAQNGQHQLELGGTPGYSMTNDSAISFEELVLSDKRALVISFAEAITGKKNLEGIESLPKMIQSELKRFMECPIAEYNYGELASKIYQTKASSGSRKMLIMAILLTCLAAVYGIYFYLNQDHSKEMVFEEKKQTADSIVVQPEKVSDIKVVESKKATAKENDFAKQCGRVFLEMLRDTMKGRPDLTYGEGLALRNDFIVLANNQWKNLLESKGIELHSQKGDSLQQKYQKAYWEAYLESQDVLNKLNQR